MNRASTVFNSAWVIVERFDHPEHRVHCDHDSEIAQDIAITFVERGSFALQEERSRWAFGRGDVLVSAPGVVRRYQHFQEYPDDVCLSVSFAPDTVEDALGKFRRPKPELTVDALHQRYERTDRETYIYSSRGGSFQANLAVDEDDLVVQCEGVWERVGRTRNPPRPQAASNGGSPPPREGSHW